MNTKEELIEKFKNLHNQILNELIAKKNIDEINDLYNLYDEYEKLYEELKSNYQVDYTAEFDKLNNYIIKFADTLRNGALAKQRFQDSIANLQKPSTSQNNESIKNDLEHETIDSLIERLVKYLTTSEEFKNIKTTTIIKDIDDLVNKIIKMIYEQYESGIITLDQRNNYFKKITSLGFKTNEPNCVLDINEKLRKISMLAEEKQATRDLGETNKILEDYLKYADSIQEAIEYAEKEGIICRKQVELYDVILEECKEIMFAGKRI